MNYRLGVIMVCQCRSINYSKYSILVWDADCGGGCKRELESIKELSVLSARFCCEPKTALKSKIYLKEKKCEMRGLPCG